MVMVPFPLLNMTVETETKFNVLQDSVCVLLKLHAVVQTPNHRKCIVHDN